MTTTLPSALPPALHAELEAAGLDPQRVLAAVVDAVAEDLPGEDVTSAATLDPSQQAWADLVARGDGVVAGLAVAEVVFRHVVGPQVELKRQAADGAHRLRAVEQGQAAGDDKCGAHALPFVKILNHVPAGPLERR